MATVYNISQLQGSSLSLRFSVKDGNNNSLNINGYTVSGYIKNKYDDTDILMNLQPTIFSATSGLVDVFLSGSQTANLPVGVFRYDIECQNTSGTVIKISRGYYFSEPEITR